MKLELHEVQGPLWQKLAAHLNEKLRVHRARVENPAVPEAERLGLCWQIKTIKEFLELAEQPAPKGDGRRP